MGAYGQGKIGYADANHRLGESFESGGVTTIFVNVQRLFSPAELLAFTRNTVRAAFISEGRRYSLMAGPEKWGLPTHPAIEIGSRRLVR